MESVPGTKTALSQEEFFAQVNKIGLSVIGQSEGIAVADKKMYALRDVTATVSCIPLIASASCPRAGLRLGQLSCWTIPPVPVRSPDRGAEHQAGQADGLHRHHQPAASLL